MNAKLIINLRDGILDVEGSDEFVRDIYRDFKGEVAKRLPSDAEGQKQISAVLTTSEELTPEKKKRSKRTRGGSGADGTKARSGKYKPTFDSKLDLTGLGSFYDKLNPVNAFEKILIFAVFLREQFGLHPVSKTPS